MISGLLPQDLLGLLLVQPRSTRDLPGHLRAEQAGGDVGVAIDQEVRPGRQRGLGDVAVGQRVAAPEGDLQKGAVRFRRRRVLDGDQSRGGPARSTNSQRTAAALVPGAVGSAGVSPWTLTISAPSSRAR